MKKIRLILVWTVKNISQKHICWFGDVLDNAVKVWMDGLSNRSEGTRKLYFRHFKKFYGWAGKSPEQLRELKWKEDQAQKPWERNQVENLVRKYIKHLEENNFSYVTMKITFSAIRSFFKKNGLPLNLDESDMPRGESLGGSITPTKEQIRKVYERGSDRMKALIMFLKDSGLRVGDALIIKW